MTRPTAEAELAAALADELDTIQAGIPQPLTQDEAEEVEWYLSPGGMTAAEVRQQSADTQRVLLREARLPEPRRRRRWGEYRPLTDAERDQFSRLWDEAEPELRLYAASLWWPTDGDRDQWCDEVLSHLAMHLIGVWDRFIAGCSQDGFRRFAFHSLRYMPVCVRRPRKGGAVVHRIGRELVSPTPRPDQVAESAESRRLVGEVVAALPERDGAILARNLGMGEPLRVLAEECGCSPQNLAWRRRQLVEALRGRLRALDPGGPDVGDLPDRVRSGRRDGLTVQMLARRFGVSPGAVANMLGRQPGRGETSCCGG